MHLRQLARACGIPLLCSHCGGNDTTELLAPVVELSLVTFNAAIGVGLAPYAEQRLTAIERDLPALSADVVCLQELWQPPDIARMSEALADVFPYAHRSVRARGAASGGPLGPACSGDDADRLTSCLEQNCAGVDEAGLPLCAIASCADVFTEVSSECQQCVAANQSAASVEELIQICAAVDGGAAAYDDQTGLLLLSRLPLEAPDFLELESSLGDRGVLSARVETDFTGPVDVYCTHLAASLSDVPYPGPHGSWQGERVQQIERFLLWVEETRATGAAVLLGDMNCGPATDLARAASPDAFERFADAGFEAPYADADGRCTFCSSNPHNGRVTDMDEGALIDHVLVSSLSGGEVSSVARVFDEQIEIDSGEQLVTTARSDHYGVRVTLAASEIEP